MATQQPSGDVTICAGFVRGLCGVGSLTTLQGTGRCSTRHPFGKTVDVTHPYALIVATVLTDPLAELPTVTCPTCGTVLRDEHPDGGDGLWCAHCKVAVSA